MSDVPSIYEDFPPDDPPMRVIFTDFTADPEHKSTILVSKNMMEQPKIYDHLQECIEGTNYFITNRTSFYKSQMAKERLGFENYSTARENEIILVFYSEDTAWFFEKLYNNQEVEDQWSALILFLKEDKVTGITFDCTISRPFLHSCLGLMPTSTDCGDCKAEIIDAHPQQAVCRKCNQTFCHTCHHETVQKMYTSRTNARCPRCGCARLIWDRGHNRFLSMEPILTAEERKLYDNPAQVKFESCDATPMQT